MFYCDDWAFFHVPKTSGTNILKRAPQYVVPGFKDRRERHNPVWYWEREYNLTDKKYYSVVRHPYTRILSVWSYVTRQKCSFEYFLDNSVDLYDWVEWADGLKILYDYRTTQCEFLDPRVKVFKYETELPLLEEELGFKFLDTREMTGTYGDWRKW